MINTSTRSVKRELMNSNQAKILEFIGEDISKLKLRGTSIKLIKEEAYSIRGKTKIRSTYIWRVNPKLLIFDCAEQVDFNNEPILITLSKEDTTFFEFENCVNMLVELIGNDLMIKGIYLPMSHLFLQTTIQEVGH